MVAVLLLAQLLAPAPCDPAAARVLQAAAARLEAFDLAGALDRLESGAARGCEEGEIAEIYLVGLRAAADAYRQGGSPSVLEPVREAVVRLAARAQLQPGPAEIARLVLQAAAAASQSERDEMHVFLTHAVEMEVLQRAARQPGAPLLSALEVAGDLWLQVHRYDEARRFYARAAEELGRSPRILAGLARTAAREDDYAEACARFRGLLEWWGSRPEQPREIVEARRYVQQAECEGR